MRYIIYGAGAVGGVIGARLHQHGHDVALIARGAHHAAIRDHGLRIDAPEGSSVLPIPVYDHPSSASIGPDDVVLLTVKGQDTEGALRALAASAPPDIAVACVQNGVANERSALRLFANVYGVSVILPAQHLEPGVVVTRATPVSGILDIGRVPSGVDARARAIAATLGASGFSSMPQDAIMRWKYAKLLNNLSNAVYALSSGDGLAAVDEAARAEGEAALVAAGIDMASVEEDKERRGDLFPWGLAASRTRGPSSTWQSVARGTGAVESDYLNGEIVLLGRLHGIATPVNEALARLVAQVARAGAEPGGMSADELFAATVGSAERKAAGSM
jgi:2-dehydropantoate 2-reductase